MKKIFTLIAILFATISMTSCSLCGVDGTEEGVFIKKPLFFGKGGVEKPGLSGKHLSVRVAARILFIVEMAAELFKTAVDFLYDFTVVHSKSPLALFRNSIA